MKQKLKILHNKLVKANLFTFGLVGLASVGLTINYFSQVKPLTKNHLLENNIDHQAARVVNYVPWTSEGARRIIDVFSSPAMANRILTALKTANTSVAFDLDVNSTFTKEQLQKITELDLSNLSLTEIDDIFNPALVWSNLWSINLSNNNFGDYEIKFAKAQMPKLYKILASYANLNKMIDVSSYVEDPFDQTQENTDARKKAEEQYNKPLRTGVPRFYDLSHNSIREIPKYYLKINLAYLNLSHNKLGSGTDTDPMGVYATPWYSLKTTQNTSGLLSIQDPSIRGPYGISVYNSGDKKTGGSNEYKYTDEQVARWRQSPWPIRGLTFGNYNDVPNSTQSNNLDSSVTPGSDMKADAGGKKPYFDFGNNNLTSPMVFQNGNVTFDAKSATAPQQKSVKLYLGLEDYKRSAYKATQEAIITTAKSKGDENNPNANAELLVPQPDSIFPIMNLNAWSKKFEPGYNFNRPLFGVYGFRSFNGYGLFEQTEDSRTDNSEGNDWDNAVYATDPSKDEYAGTESKTGGGIKWNVPKLSDFGKATNGTWTGLYSPNINDPTAPTLDEFIKGTNNGVKSGFWGTKGFVPVNSDTAKNQKMSFTDPTNQTYYKRYKPFRTYFVTAKSFAKTDRGADYAVNTFDGNVFYDAANYQNFNAQLDFAPSGTSRTGLMANYAENPINLFNQTKDRKLQENQKTVIETIRHFASYYGTIPSAYLTGMAPATWVSNINRPSSFGVQPSTPTPYTSSLKTSNGLYNYSSHFNVVDQISTDLNVVNNFATQISQTSNFNLSEYQNKFPQNVNAQDILNGENKFWKTSQQFDRIYLKNLNEKDITFNYDAESGSVNYQFRVYSPGYSRQGRLMQPGDSNAVAIKDATPTIDVKVNQTITGFAKAQMQRETVRGTWETFSSSAVNARNFIESVAPQSIQSAISRIIDYNRVDANLIARTFKTNYLGNKARLGVSVSAIEQNQGDLISVHPDWIKDIVKNQATGTVEFKVEIPDYTLSNGIKISYPNKLKSATYKWTGLPKATTTVIGRITTLDQAEQTFTANSFSNDPVKLKLFQDISAKNPSAITAADIFNLGAVKTAVASWKVVNANNANNFFQLYPDDANGTLIWRVRIIADLVNGIPEQEISVLWERLANQSTTLSWKPQTQLKNLLLGKSPNRIKAEFKANSESFLTVANRPTDLALKGSDLVLNDGNFSIDESTGQIQFINVQLKNYYSNGIRYTDGKPTTTTSTATTAKYLTVANSPKYQGQQPISSLKWKPDNQIIANIKNYLKTHNLIKTDPNNSVITTVEQIINQMSLYDLKQAIVNNNLNLANLSLFDLTNISSKDLQLKASLNDSVIIDHLAGTLTFKNIVFNNWQSADNFDLITYELPVHTITGARGVNTFVWANNFSSALTSLPTSELQRIFGSPTLAPAYIDALNVGQKTIGNDNLVQNRYKVDPAKIKIDLNKGTITFESKAITVTNFVEKNQQPAQDYVVTQPKTYSWSNNSLTHYQINHQVSSPNGFKDDYAKFYFGYSYNLSSILPEQKQVVDEAITKLKIPNLVNQTVQEATNLIRNSLIEQNLARINHADLARINELKQQAVNQAVKTTDFSNYFYLPSYLAFVNSFTPIGVNRTYLIAEKITVDAKNLSQLVIQKPYIVNYHNSGKTELHGLTDFSYSIFLANKTTVSFKKYSGQKISSHLSTGEFRANFLPELWKNADLATMKADLEFLTANHKNLTVRRSDRWNRIQTAWRSTFEAQNVPLDSSYDSTVVYPTDITINSGERTLKVNKLIFALYANSPTEAGTIIADYEMLTTEIWVLNTGGSTTLVTNPDTDYQVLLQQAPTVLLRKLNLQLGHQTDPSFSFKQFADQKVFYLINSDPSVLSNAAKPTTNSGPVGEIGRIDLVDGQLRLSQIVIKNPWVNGQIGPSSTQSDITLHFSVQSTSLMPNNDLVIIHWLRQKFGQNKSITDLLKAFDTAVKSNSFNQQQFNTMLVKNHGLVRLNSVFEDPLTQARLNPNTKLIDAITINSNTGKITLKNLQIVNGYVKNHPQGKTPINLEALTIQVNTSFSTEFTTHFDQLTTDPALMNLSPSEVKEVLTANPQRLEALVRFADEHRIEKPEISLEANDLLGQLQINLNLANYYEKGVNLGIKTFTYTLSSFRNQLTVLIAPIFTVIGSVGLTFLLYFLWKKYKNQIEKFYINKIAKRSKKPK
ncbi:hypothetical protein J2Z62_000573 [Mycoplasmoides fastidiosum]|uniref:ECM-binding protein homolog n=1 Tax=Mycoplasmoides fastidiosum TaxID=92758 RepID=A0ABU0LZJ8_9BACT|nr:hypothetical protein [Mycoplasmoides fastidiosum]MDQ0514135.1 hypothetical protein [Mycoplasmoides fastidiosum]UUD37457.1 hypothetical protein NPA10_02665 [Mycoplasmoides fastidiosum]